MAKIKANIAIRKAFRVAGTIFVNRYRNMGFSNTQEELVVAQAAN